jgi:hypothetical protein
MKIRNFDVIVRKITFNEQKFLIIVLLCKIHIFSLGSHHPKTQMAESYTNFVCSGNRHIPEGKLLVWGQPHSNCITFSYLIRRELFRGIFSHLQIRYELEVKLYIKLMTNS